jgi:glycosyltransferase involved in cell wall biosynthesis
MKKVVWLASWYPDEEEPFNGDFVQRHAIAVAALMDITVLHIVQKDSNIHTQQYRQTKAIGHNSMEEVHYFNYKPTGISWLDKIRFNSTYIQYGKNMLKQYIQQHGKPDFIHVHAPMKMGMLALYAKEKWGIPYIVSEQASHYEAAAPDNFFTRSTFYKTQTTKIFQQASKVTNVSTTIAKKIESIFGIPSITTIHNCVNTHLFFYKPLIAEQPFTFIHVSALGSQKNIVGMLRAFAFLIQAYQVNCQLLLVGPLNSTITNYIEELNLKEFVITTNNATYSQVATYMQQAHAFVLFSNHENFPCVVVEALCCGLPVITSIVGGVAEAINTENGILITKEDQEQLTNAMLYMIENYKHYNRAEIAKAAAEKYSYATIAKQFVQLYE